MNVQWIRLIEIITNSPNVYVHLINMRSNFSVSEKYHFLKILSALMIELAISDTVTCLFIASVLMRA